jgi:hypothetical protein
MKPILKIALPALLLVAACSDEEQPADSRARAYYQLDSLVTVESVFVTLNDGAQTWSFKPADFSRSDTDTLLYFSPEVKTRIGGTLAVEFALFTPTGEAIAEGEFGLPMSPNWRWTIAIIHSITDPSVDCSDCQGSDRFEILIPGHVDEWIYVLWRGGRT